MIGTSVQKDFIMNSLAIPRKAKQAIGGIAKLTDKDGATRYVAFRNICGHRFTRCPFIVLWGVFLTRVLLARLRG